MSAETRKVLEMFSAGKITSEDAERLLDKLAAIPDAAGNDDQAGAGTARAAKRFLRVLIERPGGDDVNVRVPLSFLRSGVKLAGILPPSVVEKLYAEGIDPRVLASQAEESLDELHVDMETKSGKHVRVFCE
jgi:hypothetical protein